jgi:hypothetical protein
LLKRAPQTVRRSFATLLKKAKKDDHSPTEDIQEVEKYKNGNELTRTALAGSEAKVKNKAM